ncbi:protein kinase domain-containing protein [Streptomyces herbicida]|uniref:protein kinase domain-containing protein n=1 Tax=Streptomyces herbicida TaxID=3065675 RepID=UPI00292F688A|nr:PQQ-binding-like beta-propeller repeat protein [Streptomyces sp. NEAU-HV9]
MDALRAADPRRIGPYEVLGRLGAGGMGEVYLAESRTGLRLAVKVVRAEHAEDRTFRARFRHEVRAAQTVGGAGTYTARVVDADTGAERPWMATEFVEGPNLRDAVLDGGALPRSAVRVLAGALGEALAAIHAKGMVHRDLKPSNILLGADGPRVIDFGIVRALEATSLTRTGAVVGSVGYVSPEQIRNGGQVGPPSDIFSLGAVLAYAAAGREPFGEGQDSVVLLRILTRDFDLSGVPEELRPLVAACLREDPLERPTPADLLASTGHSPTSLRAGIRPGWYAGTPDPTPRHAAPHWIPTDRASGVEYAAPHTPATTAPGTDTSAPPAAAPVTGAAAPGTAIATTTAESAPDVVAPGTGPTVPEPDGDDPASGAATPATDTGASASAAAIPGTDIAASLTDAGAPGTGGTAPVTDADQSATGNALPVVAVTASVTDGAAPVADAYAARVESGVSVIAPVAPEAEAVAPGTDVDVYVSAAAAPEAEAPVPDANATPVAAPGNRASGAVTAVAPAGVVAPGRRRLLKVLAGGAVVAAGAGVGGGLWQQGAGSEGEGGDKSVGAPRAGGKRTGGPAVLRWQYDVGGLGGLDGPCVALAPDGSAVCIGSSSGTLHAVSRTGSRRWKIKLGDEVSTPVVTADGVFCVTWDHDRNLRRLRAVALDGTPKWQQTLGDHGYSIPVLLGDHVLVVMGSTDAGGLRCVAPDGSERWLVTTPAGPTGIPLVAGGVVYTGSYGDRLLALEATDGSMKWSVPGGADVTVSVLAGTTLLADSAPGLQGFRSTDGKRLWRNPDSSPANPVPGNRSVAVATENGGVYALRAADGTKAWTREVGDGTPSLPSAVVSGDAVYARVGNRIQTLALSDGRPRWSADIGQTRGDDQHTPVIRAGRLYVPSGTGIAAVDVTV